MCHVDQRRRSVNVIRRFVGNAGDTGNDHERDHDSRSTNDHRVAHGGASVGENRPNPLPWRG
jgi:hypothetical protein